ncbi:MAG: DUF3500 domain-containing protein [Gemmatimonadota bacterium]|nr:DUF3500 domain-containing protein [Gemmatimonadota bacterium]
MKPSCTLLPLAGVVALLMGPSLEAQQRRANLVERSARAEAEGLADEFLGITTNGEAMDGLFSIRSTGVSTAPVVEAADRFLTSLSTEQRDRTTHPVDDDEWRKWMNQHFYVRSGAGFDEMTESQRDAAFALLGAALSAEGLKLSRDIMRLNHTLGELTDNFEEYGEWLYWITVMGEPSGTEPWGWQIDGHHLVINYFVLGDQVVMSPVFLGSEPVHALEGKYAGTRILQAQQDQGLAMLRALTQGQRDTAVLSSEKEGNNNLTEAFKDNVILDYAGVSAAYFTPDQQDQLLALIGLFVANLREGHAAVKMEEVRAHLGDTHFAWIGGDGEDQAYYYRIHSPVILVEFDHQRPVALRDRFGSGPSREHIHVVVRTPNGNDYGKDLLRQHLREHPHPHG